MSESIMIVEEYRTYWVNSIGEFHRIGGPAIEHQNGTKMWHQNGKLHRLNGPAIEYENGSKEWWIKGKRHRVDGPAIEYSDGEMDWFINGIQFYSQEEWFEALPKENQIAYLFNMEGSK